jgi:hypothetical protein
MYPLTGVMSLIKTCGAVAVGLKELHDGAQSADLRCQTLTNEVEDFARVLGLMEATLRDERISDAFDLTGHIGNHWRHAVACLEDGRLTLDKLGAVVTKAGKSVRVLDGARKHLRLNAVADEIGAYLQRIRTLRDTVQLSASTIAL